MVRGTGGELTVTPVAQNPRDDWYPELTRQYGTLKVANPETRLPCEAGAPKETKQLSHDTHFRTESDARSPGLIAYA